MADVGRNIVILPPPDVVEEAERRSRAVSSMADRWSSINNVRLSHGQKRWPHLTLYQFGIPEGELGSLEAVVAEVASESPPFSVTLQGYELYCDTGTFWTAQEDHNVSDGVRDLHADLVGEVNPLRKSVVLEQQWPLFRSDSGLSPQQRKYLGEYGYPTAFDEYVPHITIGDTEAAKQIIKHLPEDPISFKVAEIRIGELGPYGTFPGPLKTFKLKG